MPAKDEQCARLDSSDMSASAIAGRRQRRAPRVWDRGLPSLLLIVTGAAIAAISFNAFLRPVAVAPGGIVGASLVLHRLTGIEPGYLQWMLNAVILAACGPIMGRRFVFRSLAGTLLLPLFVVLTASVKPATTNIVLAALCGGGGVGLGVGMVFRAGSSVGGFSTAAAAINRKTGVQLDHLLFTFDTLVLLAAASLFSVEQALSGLVGAFVVGKTVRSVLTGFHRSCVAMIVSRQASQIRDAILHQIPLGLTVLNGRGGFTDIPSEILMVVMKPTEAIQLKAQVRALDSEAFVVLLDASEVRGRGFAPHA